MRHQLLAPTGGDSPTSDPEPGWRWILIITHYIRVSAAYIVATDNLPVMFDCVQEYSRFSSIPVSAIICLIFIQEGYKNWHCISEGYGCSNCHFNQKPFLHKWRIIYTYYGFSRGGDGFSYTLDLQQVNCRLERDLDSIAD